jgi:hypothetical protein
VSEFRVTKAVSFIRPANTTQYAANELVANHGTAGSVVVPAIANAARFPGGNGSVKAVTLSKSGVVLTDAKFRVHLFTLAPTVSNGDNGAFAVTNGMAKAPLGHVDFDLETLGTALGDGLMQRIEDLDFQFDTVAPGHSIYALVETLDTYTPASAEVFTVEVELERD